MSKPGPLVLGVGFVVKAMSTRAALRELVRDYKTGNVTQRAFIARACAIAEDKPISSLPAWAQRGRR